MSGIDAWNWCPKLMPGIGARNWCVGWLDRGWRGWVPRQADGTAQPTRVRRATGSRVALAPGIEGLEHRHERLTLLRQGVLVPRRMLFVEARCNYAVRLEQLQARRQGIGC